jgi:phosphatidyl-N-methylethanolamine N-methyltransferase
VTLGSLLVAAVGLALERACYVGIARAPGPFQRLCARPTIVRLGEPIDVVQKLFYGFKVLQLSLFVGWCWAHEPAAPALLNGSAGALLIGGVLLVAGQILNASVFYRLGRVGVFYGNILGHAVPWCREFPFSVLSHPQYVGTVLSIWGFFLAARFPGDDWFVLPALETVYYVVGARLEDRGVRAALSVSLAAFPPEPARSSGPPSHPDPSTAFGLWPPPPPFDGLRPLAGGGGSRRPDESLGGSRTISEVRSGASSGGTERPVEVTPEPDEEHHDTQHDMEDPDRPDVPPAPVDSHEDDPAEHRESHRDR